MSNRAAAEKQELGSANGHTPSWLTLGALPDSELTQAVKFLQERAGEALRLAREQSERDDEPNSDTEPSVDPVPPSDDPAVVHLKMVAEAAPELHFIRAYLQDYADGINSVSHSDERLLAATDALRRLMEAIYQQPITFTTEVRPDGGATAWDVRQAKADAMAALAAGAPDGTRWVVRNLTDAAITLTGRDEPPCVIPAFGSRTFEAPRNPSAAFDDVGERVGRNELEVTEIAPVTARESTAVIVLGLEFWLVPIFVAVTLIWGNPSWWLVGVPVIIGLPLLARIDRDDRAALRKRLRGAARRAPRRATELMSFLLVILFALVVPTVAIFLGADLHDVFERARRGPITDGGPDDLTLVARAMQVLFIAAASMLPALLYFQFDREQLGTVWEKFTRQIYRLDPDVRTEPALLSKYAFLRDEVFGRGDRNGQGSLLPGKRSPIIVATVVIVFGWLLTLLNPQIGTISDQAGFVSLFQPHQSAVTFAFLGAYVFALGALLRGYVRRDLRPKSYSDITVRILTVVALAWLLQVFFPDDEPLLLAFAFATGLVPQTAFTLLREVLQRRGGKPKSEEEAIVLPEDDPLPLTNLEGIDLYDRARLGSEGITNIEALAHCDLIELMLQTRIPAARLVDWVDQSILYLHVFRQSAAGEPAAYDVLRRAGIRNATDLLRVADKAEKRAPTDKALLEILGPTGPGGPQRLSVIVDAIEDEEWISNLMYWRVRGDLDNPRVKALLSVPK